MSEQNFHNRTVPKPNANILFRVGGRRFVRRENNAFWRICEWLMMMMLWGWWWPCRRNAITASQFMDGTRFKQLLFACSILWSGYRKNLCFALIFFLLYGNDSYTNPTISRFTFTASPPDEVYKNFAYRTCRLYYNPTFYFINILKFASVSCIMLCVNVT